MNKIPEVSKYYQAYGRLYLCTLIKDDFVYLKDCILKDESRYKWTKEVVFLPEFFKDFKLVNEKT